MDAQKHKAVNHPYSSAIDGASMDRDVFTPSLPLVKHQLLHFANVKDEIVVPTP